MKIINFPVPRGKVSQFFEIFNVTECRHTANPYWVGDELRVSFEPKDVNKFFELWNRITTPIVEIDGRVGMLRKLWRRGIAKLNAMLRNIISNS